LNWAIDDKTIAVKPAAGPLTLKCDLLRRPTTIPPIAPVTKPDINGAPDACAIPRHNGIATKKTAILAGMSCFKFGIETFNLMKLGLN